MFAGHLGAGLLLKGAGRQIGLGWLFLGVMWLDLVLWVLVLLGIESVHAPEKLRTMADLRFDFPFSHGLMASVLWAGSGFGAGWFFVGRKSAWRIGVASGLAAAVFSHFVLDWLVHAPEMPVLGRDSTPLGMGLGNYLPLAWGLEAALVAAGVVVYLKMQPLSRRRAFTLIIVMLLVMMATVVGQSSNTPPPSMAAMAGSSAVMIAILVWFGWWLERP